MKRHTLKTATLAVISFGWISLASAQGHMGSPMHRPGGPEARSFGPRGQGGPGGLLAPMIAKRLQLSDEQKAQWKAIHEKERASAGPLMKAVADAREALDKALEGDGTDAVTVGQAAIALRNAHRTVEAQHKTAFEAVKAILTPEQLGRLEEMEKHSGERHPAGFGPGSWGDRGRRQGRGLRGGNGLGSN